jgi:hypothetical protein
LTAEVAQKKALITQEMHAGEEKLQRTLQHVAELEAKLETALEAVSEVEVSLVVQNMAKNVCDAENQAEIATLKSLLDNRARELEEAQADIQAISIDKEQLGATRCWTGPVCVSKQPWMPP